MHACESVAPESDGQENLDFMLNSLPIGVITTDRNQTITFANSIASRLLGRDHQELTSKKLGVFLSGLQLDSLAQKTTWTPIDWSQVAVNQESEFDSTARVLEILVTQPPANREETWLISLREIEGRNNSAPPSQNLNRMASVGQVAAGVAHEINTPIHYIGDNIRFLRDAFSHIENILTRAESLLENSNPETDSTEKTTELHEAIHHQEARFYRNEIPAALAQTLEGIENVANIARALKEFSHPGPNEPELTDINQLVETALLVSRSEWKHHAELELNLSESLPRVRCYPGSIRQSLLNLITNASHAMRDKPAQNPATPTTLAEIAHTLTVSTTHRDQHVLISVRDTGTGIPEHVQRKIFEPFFTTKPEGQGTGQGLGITHQLVTVENNGTLNFSSKPGIGSCFEIELPIETI